MKKITVCLLIVLAIQSIGFAQSPNSENIEAIKQVVYEKYSSEFDATNYDELQKWMIYGLGERSTSMNNEHRPAMVYILNGSAIVKHYYVFYVDGFGYSSQYCDCCHVEMQTSGQGLIAHCEAAVCTTPPYTEVSQLTKLLPFINRSDRLKLVLYPSRP
ncbi:MAG TPA: hypothetical protein PKC21_07915 [Oligoflexia bacterium]|nr:hypothetical protein [Oligoflexia bacterium]HMR25263.1 hypothetical protein [Oligoflexia bacterium]